MQHKGNYVIHVRVLTGKSHDKTNKCTNVKLYVLNKICYKSEIL